MYKIFITDKYGNVSLVHITDNEKEAISVVDWWYETALGEGRQVCMESI